ncbi:MOSC domain-containing protein [Sulfurimonas sp. HSL1-6]|uniref:MOSC domain-containing protein n=1 Tax=Thiomicrolovo immobilis TaxID=3131935 RepID=UPI0031F8D178
MNERNGRVVSLIIGPEAKSALESVPSVTAVAGRGLAGDRYYFGRGSFNGPQFDPGVREVTLIAAEAIAECNRRLGTALSAADFRRNIVTEGIDFAALKGQRFRIGEVTLRWVRSAPPCRYLSRLLGEDMMTGLKGIGGIRAVIETGGTINEGDTVHVLL